MTAGYAPGTVWLAIAAIGLVTFALRFSFVYLFGHVQGVPPRLERALRYVPPAVLAALVVPAVVEVGPTLAATLGNHRLVAGVAAALVARYTGDTLATIVAGMVVLWTLGLAA